MHQISNHSAYLAHQHALQAEQHGKSVVSIARAWNKKDGKHLETAKVLEEHGMLIQQYAQESLNYAHLLNVYSGSTTIYCFSLEAHVKAARTHVEAVELYLEMIREKLKEFKNDS
ncbi:hypothetical protein AMR41_05235 [Hapalosiphon sp. MRB220]|nr:hypothetical protein AMR41_05235 [Hapalosiphon sp. MRB220]